MVFLSQKGDRNMIFTNYWKVLALIFSGMVNTVFFHTKSWWKDDIYWLLKRSCFEVFGDRKYGLFFSQEVDGKMIFTGYWEVFVSKFSVVGNTAFFQPKSWWKDDIYLVFLSFPWYSRTWEIWLFAQCRLFVLVYSNQGVTCKRFKVKRYYLPKEIIDNYNIIINEKNFYDQLIDSDIKRYEEIRKLTTTQGEDCTTWCLLDYDYIRNLYRLIEVDLSRQKELDADTKAIQQIEFLRQLKNLNNDYNATNADGTQSVLILTILEKFKEIKIFWRKCNSIIKDSKLTRNRTCRTKQI